MKSSTYMYSVANLSVLIWAETSNTWHFRVILQGAWRSLVKLEVSYAWLVLLTFLASVLMVLNELMAVKRLSASCMPFKWHSTWTIYRVSNFTEFKTTTPLWKTLNITGLEKYLNSTLPIGQVTLKFCLPGGLLRLPNFLNSLIIHEPMNGSQTTGVF